MAITPLLRTKLYIPPTRPGWVPRLRLVEQLNTGRHRKLTLLSAPAGYGKTTLLSAWVAQLKEPVAWLSLDETDNDPLTFWTYLIAALQTIDINLGQESMAFLQATPPPAAQTFLIPLINHITALPQRVVLILDDVHLITSPAIQDGLSFLLNHHPQPLHLVLSTRADPALPIVRLRARGQLTELRIDDLRFTIDEAADFLSQMVDSELSTQDVKVLETRTEGWATGLYLAALSLQNHETVGEFMTAFSGSHHYVLEYLSQEALQHQPEAVLQFLTKTAVLDRFCGPLCDAITGGDDGHTMLNALHQANLFITPLDDKRYWHRYHHLFADLLTNQLKKQATSEQISDLYHRASQWFETNNLLDEAVRYAFRAQNFERVAHLAESAARAGTFDSQPTTLLRWLEALPEPVRDAHPRLRLHQAWALILNERLDLAQQILQSVKPSLQSAKLSAAQRQELVTLHTVIESMALGLTCGYAGDMTQAAQMGAEARDRALTLGNIFMAIHATVGLALAQYHQGHLLQAAEHYRQIINLAEQHPKAVENPLPSPLAAVGHIGLATIHLEWNELDTAARYLEQGLALGKYGAAAHSLVNACVAQSRLRQALGDMDGAFEALDQADQIYRVKEALAATLRLHRQRTLLNLSMGNVKESARWIHETNARFTAPSERPLPDALRETLQILLARLYLAQEEPGQALTILSPLQAPAEAAGRLGRSIEIALLQALALQAQGDTTAAFSALEHTLSLAEPERYTRIYLDEGEPVAQLLTAFCRHPSAPAQLQAYGKRLLAAFPAPQGPLQQTTSPDMVEPLTQRELQVLRLMAAERSAPEIAEALIVAVSTVRSHIKNIYQKLGTHNRYETVERARSLDLL